MNGRAALATDRANGRRQLTPWQARVLQQADDIIRATRRELAAWKDGYRHGQASREDDYERGFHDGVIALKRAQHDVVALARLEHERWGPGGRKRFGQPRPGDFPGRDGAAG
jgi:hypothetical protein